MAPLICLDSACDPILFRPIQELPRLQERANIIARTENGLASLGCLFAACQNGSSSHSFVYFQFSHRHGGVFVSSPNVILEESKAVDSHDVI